MTRKTIELADEIDQLEPLAFLVFAAGGEWDYKVFADLAEAEHYASDQQEEAEDDGWPIYPLYAGNASADYGVPSEHNGVTLTMSQRIKILSSK